MDHKHKECEHEIKYCSKCDVCYCEKCQKEWYHYNLSWSGSYTYNGEIPYTTLKQYPTITVSHAHEGSA